MPADVETESSVFNGERPSPHARVLFQHHARRPQVRQLVSRRQSCRTGAEDHYSVLVVTCSHSCVCGPSRLVACVPIRNASESEKAASPYPCVAVFLSQRCQELVIISEVC